MLPQLLEFSKYFKILEKNKTSKNSVFDSGS